MAVPTHHTAVTNGATCRACPTRIKTGDRLVRLGSARFVHLACYERGTVITDG